MHILGWRELRKKTATNKWGVTEKERERTQTDKSADSR